MRKRHTSHHNITIILYCFAILLSMLISRFRGPGGSTIFASVGASISSHPTRHQRWGASINNNEGHCVARRCYHHHTRIINSGTFLGSHYSSSRGRRTNNAHHQSLANTNKPPFLSLQIMHQLRGGGEEIVSSRSSSSSSSSFTTNTNHEQCSSDSPPWRRVYLAVGSNLGDRYQNIAMALSKLQTQHVNSIRVITTSYLRMTSPMYVTDQPSFLNGAVLIETTLLPLELLSLIKQVESDLGRNISSSSTAAAAAEQPQRYGPRPVDLDILLYDGYEVINPNDGSAADTLDENHVVPNSLVLTVTDKLEVPHPRMSERGFVLEPMCDLERIVMKEEKEKRGGGNHHSSADGGIVHPIFNKTMSELLNSLLLNQNNNNNNATTTTASNGDEQAVRVLPLPRNRMLTFNKTLIMGILNVTPDSFSDGGSTYSNSSELAALHALQLHRDGADIIDVGGESTRPGADEMDVQTEMDRVIPVITRIRQTSPDVPISIDTRHSTVARAAIEAGADIVNDVSGGTHDGDMFSCVASLGVPMIIMHMRGNPRTMQSLTNYSSDNGDDDDDDDDDGVVSGVARELMQRSTAAELAGIPRWLQVVDPGIGFAKDMNGNLSLLRSVNTLRQSCDNLPLLFGPSRKGFIGNITGETNPKERDYGTVAACLASIQRSKNDRGENICNVLRVHNVKAIKQAVLVYETIQNTNR